MKKLYNHELAEIQVPAASPQQQFNFPDMQNLRGAQVWGLQVYHTDQLPKAPVSGNAVFSAVNVLQNCFITLVDEKGDQFLKDIPAADFNTLKSDLSTSTNFSESNAKALTGKKINWAKSFIKFATAPAPVAITSFLMSISYTTSKETPKVGCQGR